ncbi:DUF4180 domain-containing protein [Amycolatopsis cihanbeyliensis]|uniref:Uncharacterized protein DUF4180 n=1 Tax=Amycolatopsis cihanbeyliensis TaxID=1128664 RepID=A0A542DGG2_AMYCI|nr:DUF4180 domain-containing protein [Amycolatopsis cihanbeyliensis]TQJ02178.1 uncharacterized protein DUF4180 [Amycolatopsis cihanbeyliensis]
MTEMTTDSVVLLHGTRVLHLAAEGPKLDSAQSALDLIGHVWGHEAEMLAVPVARCGDEFFDLETRIAGEVLQKFTNYHVPLAIIGDLSGHLAESSALRAFVHESNQGRQVWFLADLDELADRLARR